MAGRPSKLTPELQQALAHAVVEGLPLPTACAAAGVSHTTVLEWLSRGESRDPDRPATRRYAEFATVIRRAQAEDQRRRLARITQAAKGGAVVARKTVTKPDGTVVVEERHAPPDWRADAWLVERVHAGQYGAKAKDAAEAADRPSVVVILPDNGRGPRPPGGRKILELPAAGADAAGEPGPLSGAAG